MSGVSDFFDNLKERLSSPFIFSFLTSWFVVNWKITVALFTSSEEIHRAGYVSIFDLIGCQLEHAHYGWPLTVALFYTFAYPFIRSGIDAFNTWVLRIKNYWNTSINDRGKIKTMQNDIDERGRQLTDFTDKKTLQGDWIFKYQISDNENEVKLNVRIDESRIYSYNRDDSFSIFNIQHYYYERRRNRMLIVLEKDITPPAIKKMQQVLQREGVADHNFPTSSNELFVCDLRFEHNSIVGKMNQKILVTFTKLPS